MPPDPMRLPLTRRAALAGLATVPLARTAAAQPARGVDLSLSQIPTAGGMIVGLSDRPPGAGPFPVVIVATDNIGTLAPFVTGACHGLAKEGFLAVAPDLFIGAPPDGTVMQRIDSARDWAGQNGGDPARLGIVGFGLGGRAAWLYDAYGPALKAAVAWYAPLQGATSPAQPTTALDAAARLHAPILGLYGKNDGTPQRVLLDAEAKAKQAGHVAEMVQYVGAGKDFAVAGASFDEAATLDGWKRTIAWLRRYGVG